jgi:hypothetical protein
MNMTPTDTLTPETSNVHLTDAPAPPPVRDFTLGNLLERIDQTRRCFNPNGPVAMLLSVCGDVIVVQAKALAELKTTVDQLRYERKLGTPSYAARDLTITRIAEEDDPPAPEGVGRPC